MPPKILILGGTAEARELAAALIEDDYDVVTSLAGVTQHPLPPPGVVRRGGFGGEQGLADYLAANRFDAVADATHPFAVVISRNAQRAAVRARVLYCRLERPPWSPKQGDRWIAAATPAEAVALLPDRARVFLTIGGRDIGPFMIRADLSGLVRTIETPAETLTSNWTLILARPPFTPESEMQLIAAHAITHLVTKNSGGEDTRAKLVAARATNIPVIMIARPDKPPGPSTWPVEAMVTALKKLLSP